jgi:hypothetical protein
MQAAVVMLREAAGLKVLRTDRDLVRRLQPLWIGGKKLSRRNSLHVYVNITWQAAPRGMNSSMMRTRQPFDLTGFPTSNRFRTTMKVKDSYKL